MVIELVLVLVVVGGRGGLRGFDNIIVTKGKQCKPDFHSFMSGCKLSYDRFIVYSYLMKLEVKNLITTWA